MSKRVYTPSQREQARVRAEEIGPAAAGRELGIPPGTIAYWQNQTRQSAPSERKPLTRSRRSTRGSLSSAESASSAVARQLGSEKRIARYYSPSERARALELAAKEGVTAAANQLSISRFSIYDWRRRTRLQASGKHAGNVSVAARDEDQAGLRDRRILTEWRAHPGLGPSQVRNQMRRQGLKVSLHTVRCVLEEHGYVTPKVRRQAVHDQRYEAVRPNHLWHLDFLHRHVHKQKVYVLLVLDDFSRFIVGAALWDGERVAAVQETFLGAVSRHGRPEKVMSDGGSAFYSWKGIGMFTRLLEELEVDQLIASTPEVNGKLEVLNANIQKELFFFNLEVIQDVASDALVGFAVTDVEDEEAVRLAYEAGLATAGSGPLGLSLDNRPSNHTAGVDAAIGTTILLRSTPGRGQAKAPLEGAFGLFQQALPPLVLSDLSPREMARSAFEYGWTCWCIGRNGKPRKRLKDLTPAQACSEARPTPEQVQAAKDWILELKRREQRAQLTREARQDPARLGLLTQGLAEFGIPDDEDRLALALACYAREAVLRGLSIFRAKQALGSLPADVDPGAYLGGIIRQLHTQLELERYSDYLVEQRLRLNDLTLAPLQRAAEQLRRQLPAEELPRAFVDHALIARWEVDVRFWGREAQGALAGLPAAVRGPLYQSLSRRIAATFKTDRGRRADLIARLAEGLAVAA